MKKTPYGESNYKEVIDENMYYIDKTMFNRWSKYIYQY